MLATDIAYSISRSYHNIQDFVSEHSAIYDASRLVLCWEHCIITADTHQLST
jgi:hypothetical protein